MPLRGCAPLKRGEACGSSQGRLCELQAQQLKLPLQTFKQSGLLFSDGIARRSDISPTACVLALRAVCAMMHSTKARWSTCHRKQQILVIRIGGTVPWGRFFARQCELHSARNLLSGEHITRRLSRVSVARGCTVLRSPLPPCHCGRGGSLQCALTAAIRGQPTMHRWRFKRVRAEGASARRGSVYGCTP